MIEIRVGGQQWVTGGSLRLQRRAPCSLHAESRSPALGLCSESRKEMQGHAGVVLGVIELSEKPEKQSQMVQNLFAIYFPCKDIIC